MVTDSIGDVLTRIRNAQLAGHKVVKVPSSKAVKSVLSVLKNEGFIDTFEPIKEEAQKGRTAREQLNVFLKYYESGIPLISFARRMSKPGLRVYRGLKDIPRVSSGLGISIISTSQGVMSDREARKKKIGGEILALIS